VVTASGRYDAAARTYTLTLEQRSAPSPGQPDKLPFVIPVAVGLLARDGRPLPLQLAGEAGPAPGHERVLVLDEARGEHTFIHVDSEPIPSLLRGFSAPVALSDGLDDADLLVLLAHDTDPFNRWEAGQRLALGRMLAALRDHVAPCLDEPFVAAMRGVLRAPDLDPAFKELVLTLPGETYVAEQLDRVDPQHIHVVRETLRLELATRLHADWVWAYENHQVREGYRAEPAQSGRRALANLALGMLCAHATQIGDPVWQGRAYQRFKDASNMTDRLGALAALVEAHADLSQPALERFYEMFRHEPLVIDKWFALQARAPEPLGSAARPASGSAFARAKTLLQHPDFSVRNPNRARSLIFTLCMFNPAAFHRADAAGYVFWAERVLELDAFNPQLAARLARVMDRWSVLAEPYRSAAREAVQRVAARSGLSNDVREIVTRALEAPGA
jgi:aminopeptidase N